MDQFAELTGRQYRLFEYVGAPDADRIIVMMGSGISAANDAVAVLLAKGEKVGLLKVRMYRPFDASSFLSVIPDSVKSIAVLDRTKEPGAVGEPLFQDVITALAESWSSMHNQPVPRVIGGRYGLSSKEFTPAMASAVYRELNSSEPKRRFTIGITDDVTHLSLDWDPQEFQEEQDVHRAVFYGLGSDGTVGANKNSVKIVGEQTELYAPGLLCL